MLLATLRSRVLRKNSQADLLLTDNGANDLVWNQTILLYFGSNPPLACRIIHTYPESHALVHLMRCSLEASQ